jgi:AmmeMemoRadiSam system protein A
MNFSLNFEDKKVLLHDAREAILAHLEGRNPSLSAKREVPLRRPAWSTVESLACQSPAGAFVTLHTRANDGGQPQLRGCIGRMTMPAGSALVNRPLIDTVREMAVAAAFQDRRFSPLTMAEYPSIVIEISALSPMERCPDPQSVVVGTHGLYLSRRGRSGVLLPQVPVEQGWDLQQYLDYICVKAGLPPGSYEAPDAELSTFTAIVFSEDDLESSRRTG